MDEERTAIVAKYDAAMKEKDWPKASTFYRQIVPLHNQMGITIVEKDDDGIVMTMELGEAVRGLADGTIHGGILASFSDVAAALSLDGLFDSMTMPVTTDMHIRYYRQPRSGPLRAEAKVVHRGQRLLSSECSVTDAEGRVLTRATATYMLVPRPTPS